VREVVGEGELAAVGVAAAGFVDATGEKVRFAPHLPWLDEPVRARLEDRWGVPVLLENDATAAAHAEATYGAARGVADALVVTMGTGIGGGIILGGRLHRGWNGMAGEFGHMQVVPDGLPCECGNRGCWEQYSSGGALVRFAQDGMGFGLANLVAAFDPECIVVVGGVSAAGDKLLSRPATH
jgi:glucokinase